ncbi:putative phage tail protein [Paenibacillus sp. LPE1-1-1.1]|uniref:putative phage tail protein n=1 Tax=Paenibacillus sp. LPE1-1-1.1 TaxID=3135230 RepID=UPI003436AFF9
MRSLTEIQRDMNDYLPRYYGDIPVATNIIDREATESAQINADAYDVLAQMYVDTATWGLARWERIFGITPDELKPIDQRRSVIKSKLRGVGTVTTASIKSVAEAYANGQVEVTESGTNMLPPFNSGWTLHENTRMKQANFVGKIGASTVANPHTFKAATGASLFAPSSFSYELTTAEYGRVSVLDASLYSTTTSANGNQAEHSASFNLIEHVIRTYGVGVFGSAVTTAERVAWLKANVSKLTGNWHGYGSGPAGNSANFRIWYVPTGNWTWYSAANHTGASVAKLSKTATLMNEVIDANGFVSFLSDAPASNGTTASTINTDFVELEVYMAAGSIPQAENELTLRATAANQESSVTVTALPNTQYTFAFTDDSAGAYGYVLSKNSADATLASANISAATIGRGSVTFTTPAGTDRIKVVLSNTSALGTFTFTNPQLERGTVATPFENLPAYTVGIKFVSTLGIPANLADLETIIRETLPAHLAVSYVFTYKTFGDLEGYGVTFGAIETAGLTFGAIETWEGP